MLIINNYLSILKSRFSDANMEYYQELEEDLLEEIQNSMAEGLTEIEAVSKLSPPDEIADDFFEDRRLETARLAEGEVVPETEVAKVFKENVQKKILQIGRQVLCIFGKMLIILFVILSVFFAVYMLQELYFEKNLARIPTIGLLISGSLLMRFSQLRWKLAPVTRVMVLGAFLLTSAVLLVESLMTHRLFYNGVSYYQELQAEGKNEISFSLNTDADIEITTSEVGPNEPFRVLFDGNFKRKDIKKIERIDRQNNMSLRIDKKGILNLFTRTQKSEVIVLIPKKTQLTKFQLDLLKGDLRLFHMKTKILQLTLNDGEIYSKNIEAEQSKINSNLGDIVIEESRLNGEIYNYKGKTILSYLTGNIDIEGKHGHIMVKNQQGKSSIITTLDGKISVENSKIDNLKTFAESGQNIVAHTTGSLRLENVHSKIVSESNKGQLITKNDSGVTIVINNKELPANIVSRSGFIKWIQDPTYDLDFQASSQMGQIRNELDKQKKSSGTTISIESISGDIRIIEKME